MNETTFYIIDLLRSQTKKITLMTVAFAGCLVFMKAQNKKINSLAKEVEELKTKGE